MNDSKPETGEKAASGTDDSKQISKTTTLDDFVQLGRYSVLVCIFSELIILLSLGNMLYMVYAGATPTLIGCVSSSPMNDTDVTISFEKQQLTEKERCDLIEHPQPNGSSPSCSQPIFRTQFTSVNAEFGYYCQSANMVKFSISLQMLGAMVGSVLFGHLSDAYGRKMMMLIALLLCISSMLIASMTKDLVVFTVLRFFVNVFTGGVMVIQMVFSVECLPKKHRLWLMNVVSWSPNFVVFSLIAYLAGDWRTLTRASAVLGLPAVVLQWFLSESPRSLVQHHRVAEARDAIKRIYRIDGRQLDKALLDQVLERELKIISELRKKKNYNFIHLFYTWAFTRYTLAVSFSLMTASIINYALLFNLEKLAGSIYWNSALMGLIRYSVNILIVFVDVRYHWFGRKAIHLFATSFSACILIPVVLIYAFGLQMVLANVSRASLLAVLVICSLLYVSAQMSANELFPTPVRSLSFSFSMIFNRLGVVLAPQVFLLADLWSPLPFVAMLVLVLFAMLFFQFCIEETKGVALSEHMPPKAHCIFRRQRGKAGENKDMEMIN